MSSSISILKICKYCGNEFTAKTTVTRYCSKECNNKDYKARKRTEKIRTVDTLGKKLDMAVIREKPFLSVKEAAFLIGCSRQAIYKMIDNDGLKASNLMEKMTIIKREDIEELLEKNQIRGKK